MSRSAMEGKRPCSYYMPAVFNLAFLLKYAEFAQRHPDLFARFIPNVLPATQAQDLPGIIEHTQELQQRLVTSEGFSR